MSLRSRKGWQSLHLDYLARLIVHLHFPEENANFHLDLELKGIVDTEACTANMMGTKLEVKMKKGEAGSWAKLDIPRPVAEREVVLQKVPSEANPKVRNHGEGPY